MRRSASLRQRVGPALLQGLILCGRCGERMTVRYHQRAGSRIVPDYLCQSKSIAQGRAPCQRIPGSELDQAIAALLMERVTPEALASTLAVQEEVIRRADEARRLRHLQVERAQYEADLAQRRYLKVDPDNRLVATVLEAEWNTKLRELQRKCIKFNHLVANCLIFYNVHAISTVLEQLNQEGAELDEQAVGALSPYLRQHVNRFGQYQLDVTQPPPALNYDIQVITSRAKKGKVTRMVESAAQKRAKLKRKKKKISRQMKLF